MASLATDKTGLPLLAVFPVRVGQLVLVLGHLSPLGAGALGGIDANLVRLVSCQKRLLQVQIS